MGIMTKVSMAISNVIRPERKSGAESVGLKEFAEAIHFLNKLGITVSSEKENRSRVQIIFDPLHTGEPKFENTFEVRMNRQQLMDLYKKISSLGLCGYNIIHAIIDAIEDVETDVFFLINVSGNIEEFIIYAKNFLDVHGLPSYTSLGTARIIDFSLGGYKGIRSIVTEALISWSESIENGTEWVPAFSWCNICKNCKTNKNFAAYCKCCKIKVDDMTLKDFGQKYAGASIEIDEDGRILSEWIVKAMPECPYAIDRRPIKEKHVPRKEVSK